MTTTIQDRHAHDRYEDGHSERSAKRFADKAKRLRLLPEDNAQAELVDCERFKARVTPGACVARFKAGKVNGAPTGRLNYGEGCRGCAQGFAREGGE